MNQKVIANHLKKGYSDYVFQFIKKYYRNLNIDSKILDAGAGHYRNLKLFYDLNFKNLYAVDIEQNENLLKVPVKFIKLNLENGLPFGDKEFDIVLFNFVLMFINPDKQKFVLEELIRVTKGYLLIETNSLKAYTKNTFYKKYDFYKMVDLIEKNKEVEIIRLKTGSREKITLRRKDYAER